MGALGAMTIPWPSQRRSQRLQRAGVCRGTSTADTTPSGGVLRDERSMGTMVPSQWPLRTHFKTALEVLGDVYQAMEHDGTMTHDQNV